MKREINLKKVLIVFGTRPEAIKMAPLIREFEKHVSDFETKVCITAQHREMLDQVLDFFRIQPHFDLNLMRPNQNLYSLTSEVILAMKRVLEDFAPDYVFVHGDTTTTMATSLASFYYGAKVCHVEAGLRTFNKRAPYPEEINRGLTGVIADYHFAPTVNAQKNLIKENIREASIYVTGNTVIDALFWGLDIIGEEDTSGIDELRKSINLSIPFILVTGHRRENFGQGFINICEALREIAERMPDYNIIYPVHLNPNVQNPVNTILGGVKNVYLINPQSYPEFLWLMSKSQLIITDSGGIQEEAPSLGKPVLVMRDTTERPEAVEAGTVILVGTNRDKIVNETIKLLLDSERYASMSKLHNPYGDGTACEKIVNFLKQSKND
ncbi:MAG: UDP-N-acetylglucosamine 2-epimerase (non-hydrolyzing) [Cyclobacteriaceae bacterium]|nr:UDP-N-acetylglucosamine 2-epimerase (non-hydrolyzing) [Cyclobacteriaceae bacterium]